MPETGIHKKYTNYVECMKASLYESIQDKDGKMITDNGELLKQSKEY